MRNKLTDPSRNVPRYPHFKLTREPFPRLLATRQLSNDNAEYFGAFLNRTSVRILIDFLSRNFRLRACEIEIDGSFPVPCTQYYEKRCLAPCVASLCSRERYDEAVESVRLFLRDERETLRSRLTGQIQNKAAQLEYESAASIRDLSANIEKYWADNRLRIWLDDAVDTYESESSKDASAIYLVTTRGRRTLGSLAFPIEPGSTETALAAIIRGFYVYHAPREIRVPTEFPGRLEIARSMSTRFGRKIPITVTNAVAVTAERALRRERELAELRSVSKTTNRKAIGKALKVMLSLAKRPRSVAAIDAAHISNTAHVSVAAISFLDDSLPDSFSYWQSSEASELDTITAAVASQRMRPDLLLIDGGPAQLSAAVKGRPAERQKSSMFIAAVKPANRHSDISHFLTEAGVRIEYDPENEACRFLLTLRDAAHDLANSVHRLTRELAFHYELAAALPSLSENERMMLSLRVGTLREISSLEPAKLIEILGNRKGKAAAADLNMYNAGRHVRVLPLIIPIRYTERGRNADDLIPIPAHRKLM
ncbi:MAG: hypothetical protein ABI539_12010 [Acidobacteriota bacterium]